MVALVGLAVVGGQLARRWPREVQLEYLPAPNTTRLDVYIVQDREAVSSVRFEHPRGPAREFSHTVSLQPGRYRALITVYREDGHAVEHQRLLNVPTDGPTRFDLRE